MVICLELDADLHMAQLFYCHSLSVASVKSKLVLLFWYRLTWVVPEKGSLNRCVCVVCGDRKKGKGSPYSITERRVPELIPVLCSQPAGDVSHKPGGRLSLLTPRPTLSYSRNP